MLKKVEGIIVNSVNYGESSKIINILTKDGILGVMCKGVKSVKSPLRSFTMNLTYGMFNIYYKDENKLSILKSVDIINDFINIKKDITLVSYMSFLVDLTTQVMKQNIDKDIFNILIQGLEKINNGLNPKVITNIIELKLLDYLGVGINFECCSKCDSKENILTMDPDDGGYICQNCYTNQIIYDNKTLKMIRMYYLVNIESISELKISKNIINNINNFINSYYDRYTGLYLKSKKFLEEMVNEN